MIQASNLAIRRGSKLLFEHAGFQIHPRQKVGLTGANGSGKSSLFALLRQQLQADSGDCSYPRHWQLAHVAQEIPHGERSAIDFILDGDAELRQIQARLQQAEAEGDGIRLAELHTALDNIQGYQANARASRLLAGLGFSADDEQRRVDEFSGGWRMRLNLGRALMCRSDLLLLDEPTNHLDLDTIIWLEGWLKAYRGTLLLISHDRDFLDNICTHILHLEQQRLDLYTGNYSAFERIRAERLAAQQSQYEKQQRDIAHIESYIHRFRAKATKAKQAQSRLKALQRMQQIAPAHVDSPFRFSLLAPEKIPGSLLQLEEVSVAYQDRTVLEAVDLQLLAGDRIGLLGPNGAGKSTLIRLLAGELPPATGSRQSARETRIGYFAQYQLEQLHDEHSPLQHLQQIDHRASEAELRNYLGSFGFAGDMALQPIAPFSGGEKSRLVLAMLIRQRPNLLLLDEPTNHLDLEMREALAEALQDFDGAMVIVSHDRHLLNACCDRLLLVNERSVADFPLSLDDYPLWLSEHNKRLQQAMSGNENSRADDGTTASQGETRESKRARKQREAELRRQTQPLRKQLQALETEMRSLSESITQIDVELSDSRLYEESQREKLQRLLQENARLKKQREEAENAWLETSEALEQLQADSHTD